LTGRVSLPLALVGCCISYASYMLDHVADVGRFTDELRSARVRTVTKSRLSHVLAPAAFTLASLVTLHVAGLAALALLLGFPLAVALHGTPLLGVLTGGRLGVRRIKDIPFAKAFHTALVLGLIVPFSAFFLHVHAPALTAGLTLFEVLRNFSNTVACDFKDLERDHAEGVRTIPMALGIPATTRLLLAVDASSIALLIVGVTVGGWPTWMLALAVAVLGSSAGLVALARSRRDAEFLCTVVLDSEHAIALVLAALWWAATS
jgi:4-hydroxybenzoate polyprenyltransferase